MDLTKQHPRSAKETMAGLVSLARMTDKARAYNDGGLGEYHYDCPHDKPVLAFLGVDAATFAAHVKTLQTDQAIAKWVHDALLRAKTPEQIAAFNAERRAWAPEPGTPSAAFFEELRAKVAPGRSDVTTWFDLLDLDEGRTLEAVRA
jgi:hypothetical protein